MDMAEKSGCIKREERMGQDRGIEKAACNKQYIGKYRVIRKLGQGSEGSVYLACDEALNRLTAIKEVHGEQGEADLLKRLKHPMLPVIYDLLWDDAWYLVMEYIQGVTLHEYIERNGAAEEERARMWAKQLLDILTYLHTRKPPVIYRDLKPDNIMVCPDGRLRLVDFGAADRRCFGAERRTSMAVTLGYGAPEQMEMRYFESDGRAAKTAQPHTMARAYADERSDIYAFGKVLYYMVTGADPAKPPYTALSIRDYRPLLGDALEQIIRKCIREDPVERYQVAGEIQADLERCGRRKHRMRRRAFIRMVEKNVWLTEK